LRTAMAQANLLTNLGDKPLIVVTAEKDAQGGWMSAQKNLLALSTNSTQRIIADATHSAITENKMIAAQASQAIRDAVSAIKRHVKVSV
jgi:hypothetical protein